MRVGTPVSLEAARPRHPRSIERAPTPSCGFPDFGAVIDSWVLFPERTQAPGMSSLSAIGGDL
jgi:hypothetical protein